MEMLNNLLFPTENTCHLCQGALEGGDSCGICPACAALLSLCRLSQWEMLSLHPPLTLCVSAYEHTHAARQLIHLLKYRGDHLVAQMLGKSMASVLRASGILPGLDIAVPVPSSASRLRERGYNQAALLAREVCARTGLPLEEGALLRPGSAVSQISRSGEERVLALKGAFVAKAEAVEGRRVLLIDDVLTTGATAMACAEALLRAGAVGVWLLTACRA